MTSSLAQFLKRRQWMLQNSTRPLSREPLKRIPKHGKFYLTTPRMVQECEAAYKLRDSGGVVLLRGQPVKIIKFERDVRDGRVVATYEVVASQPARK